MKKVIALYAIPATERKILEKQLSNLAHIVYEDTPIGSGNLHADTEILVVLPSSVVDVHITERLPKLRAIVSLSAGLEHVKLNRSASNIQVINNPTFSIIPVSEYVLSCVFSAYYKSYWQNPTSPREEIFGKKALVVGYGNIGKVVTDKLRALGAEVQVFTSAPIDKKAETNGVIRCRDLQKGVAQADIISLNTSLRAETALLFGSKAFAHVKPSAILINAARGGLIDNEALLESLNDGTFRKVFLDDITGAETPKAQAIIHHSKVVYTHHTAWLTEASVNRRVEYTTDQLKALLGIEN